MDEDADGSGSGGSGGRGRSKSFMRSGMKRPKSDYLSGKGVIDLFRGTKGGNNGGEKEKEVQEQVDSAVPPPSPTKKIGSNVAALISVFNQREREKEKAAAAVPVPTPAPHQQQQYSQQQGQGQSTSQPNSQSSRKSNFKQKQQPQNWSQQDLDTAFEEMLESRNIPHNMRDKMRGLDVNIKTDFIQKHQHSDDLLVRSAAFGGSTTTLSGSGTGAGTGTGTGTGSANGSLQPPASDKSTHSRRSRRKGKGTSANREEAIDDSQDKSEKDTKSRRSRLRSRTFSKDSMKRPRSGSKSKRPKSTDGGHNNANASSSTIGAAGGSGRPASVRSFGSNKSGITAGSFGSTTGDGYISGTHIMAPEQPDDTFDPADFVHYLREVQKPEIVKIAKLHKLRLLLRNETVSWVDQFVWEGGMDEVIELLYRILAVEWREEHEDALLHETLLCLKALSTTAQGLKHLEDVEDRLFPTLLHMLFDEERKGPAEFTTRGIVISLLFTHLSAPPVEERAKRSDKILSFLRDPTAPKEEQPPTFIKNMHTVRPYKVWNREVTNTTREVFWIFLHHANVIPLPRRSCSSGRRKKMMMMKQQQQQAQIGNVPMNMDNGDETQHEYYDEDEEERENVHMYNDNNEHNDYRVTINNNNNNMVMNEGNGNDNDGDDDDDDTPYCVKFYPPPRAPVPAAPYVGGVEWDATNYIATHLDLMNGLIATQPTLDKRNALRNDLKISGFEKVMGQYLRTCKEKFYASVHDALRLWVAAAREDGWEYEDVRRGPRKEEVIIGNVGVASVVRVPGGAVVGGGKNGGKGKKEEPPRVDLETPTPRLSLNLNLGF